MEKLTYNEFASLCAEAWRTEGQGSSAVKEVHNCLLCVEKTPSMSPNQVIAAAWVIYNGRVQKKVLASNGEAVYVTEETRDLGHGTQTKVIYMDGSEGWEHSKDLVD